MMFFWAYTKKFDTATIIFEYIDINWNCPDVDVVDVSYIRCIFKNSADIFPLRRF